MDKILFEKFKTQILVVTALLTLCLIMLLAILVNLHRTAALNRQVQELETQLKSYAGSLGLSPEEELLRQKRKRDDLALQFSRIQETLDQNRISGREKVSALDFKQKYFDAQEKILARAKKAGIVVPEDLGFSEYKVSVPKEDQVGMLTSELAVMEQVVGSLIESRVKAVQEIKFAHEENFKQENYAAGKTGEPVRINLALKFTGTYTQIKNFLVYLSREKNLYTVKDIDFDKKSGGDDSPVNAQVAFEFILI